MTTIEVTTTIAAPPAGVWAVLEDVADHVTWMHDAEAIRFCTDQRAGVGTTFDCDTRIGPVRLVDRMTITEWSPERAMGVRHHGVVTGTGRFTLVALTGERTRFAWREQLTFPWWMGGVVGAEVGAPILRAVWARNLAGLRARVEHARTVPRLAQGPVEEAQHGVAPLVSGPQAADPEGSGQGHAAQHRGDR